MENTQEYVITLKSMDVLESFYDDIETPGGDEYIPDRAVNVYRRRPMSRNTHYYLTEEEVASIRNDPRVEGIDLVSLIQNSVTPHYTQAGTFDKSNVVSNSYRNWALLRCTEGSQRTNWGSDGTTAQSDTIQVNASGKNVDVIIVDGHINPNHPEFTVNVDGTGGSRVNQFDWYTLNSIASSLDDDTAALLSGSYIYPTNFDDGNTSRTDDNNHGAHVAGTVAGNTQGWARDATIYNISPYSTNANVLNSLIMWDYIRAFHKTKSINPSTGKRNPTICNCSYGTSYTWPTAGTFGSITYAVCRGVAIGNNTAALTQAELFSAKIYNSSGVATIPYYNTAIQADVQQALADGIIIIGSAGNNSFLIDSTSGQDYNNYFYATYNGTNYSWNPHRGSTPGSVPGVICVGAVGITKNETKASFSNTGPRIDIFSPGYYITSSVNTSTGGTTVGDSRNANYRITKYSGTSMASPQVCGVAATVLETYPSMTATDMLSYIVGYAKTSQMTDTGGAASDTTSLQGSVNRYLFLYKERPDTGAVYPKINYKLRPTAGIAYPRPRIRRTL